MQVVGRTRATPEASCGHTNGSGVNGWGGKLRMEIVWLRGAKSRLLEITRRNTDEFARAVSSPAFSGEPIHTHGKSLISQNERSCAVATIRTQDYSTARESGRGQSVSVRRGRFAAPFRPESKTSCSVRCEMIRATARFWECDRVFRMSLPAEGPGYEAWNSSRALRPLRCDAGIIFSRCIST